ncbi:MAG: aminoacyl-histidine dipeptidase [Planctomycetes bacterium]|nr:aminoacyl-histidine dipeptidase [Planctomycetota bacterium]
MTASDLALEPAPLWQAFLELSRIPRGSRHEAAAARWFADRARAAGCEVEQDGADNVLVRKAAAPGRENAVPIVLQCHIDMVCEKLAGVAHDFAMDGIDVWRDGELLRAHGTTLGADNGVGVAAALAVLESTDIRHGPLEVLVTTDEETGMTGAKALKPGWMRSHWMINLDSEEEGELTIGCAGGLDTVARRCVRLEPAPAGTVLRLEVSGLKGGHSGIDIGVGRANALKLLAQVLAETVPAHGLAVASIAGGSKRNAIPRESAAVVVVPAGHEDPLRADVARLEAEWRSAFGSVDPKLSLALTPATAERVFAASDATAVIGALLAGPHGVEAMSPDIEGLVQTSTNMGIAETNGDVVIVCFLTRSSIDASKRALARRIAATCALAGFETEDSGGYPGWKPEPESAIVGHVKAVHEQVFGEPMIVKAIHAGLECGLIRESYPTMEMASIGPSMWDVHTPDEHVSIPSVARFWTFLVALLEQASDRYRD